MEKSNSSYVLLKGDIKMIIYAILDEQNRVTMWSRTPFEQAQEYNIDDDTHFLDYSFSYYLKDGKLEYDESTKEQAEKQEKIIREIGELKNKLIQTDYQAIKFAEGWISVETYKNTLAQRQEWRNQINKLESELI